jgi:hypothetical protein
VLAIAKRLATVGIAILMALVTWDYYVAAPWTRDGRVRGTGADHAERCPIHDRRYAKVKPVLSPFEFIALPRHRLIHSVPEGPSSVRESRTHGSAREA